MIPSHRTYTQLFNYQLPSSKFPSRNLGIVFHQVILQLVSGSENILLIDAHYSVNWLEPSEEIPRITEWLMHYRNITCNADINIKYTYILFYSYYPVYSILKLRLIENETGLLKSCGIIKSSYRTTFPNVRRIKTSFKRLVVVFPLLRLNDVIKSSDKCKY